VRAIRDRKLTLPRVPIRSPEETVMLDLVFVALGFALIALTGLYAAGLRRF
jgi:hypothetical protein